MYVYTFVCVSCTYTHIQKYNFIYFVCVQGWIQDFWKGGSILKVYMQKVQEGVQLWAQF